MAELDASYHGDEAAIIGMAGRFPDAATIDDFWRNLCAGVESIAPRSDADLLAAGVDPALLRDPRYVKSSAALDDIEQFDAAFFGFSPLEADVTDPQQRLFLECAWEALENAGYDAQTYPGRIAVYASVSTNSYALNVYANPDVASLVGPFQIGLGNNKDHLATRVSYKLNLRGPSVNVQSACSSSLVAAHLACQSLLNGECEIALAGGVCITLPQKSGYLYQEGGILSPDGHCRAFDARAAGTVSGNGAGVVVLKRLAAARADGDRIYAVIKGSAINNDGSAKAGYTAPSVGAQAEAIGEALAVARVSPETIGYVEAHGTATPLGDPIEVAALTKAFRAGTQRRGFCALGSVKTNIGHLDAAAGVASLIKTALALHHGQIPPSLHFERPNPQIDFASSPFYVNATLNNWPRAVAPRRAGVSSFGIGGTNAHIVLEEAPAAEPGGPARPWQLLVLSAKTGAALDAAAANLAAHLRAHPELDLADAAYTLQRGRRAFAHRMALACHDRADALAALERRDRERVHVGERAGGPRPVAFLFPGQGAQHARMAAGLYRSEPVFREQIDRCADLLLPRLRLDLRDALYPADERRTTNDQRPLLDDGAPSSIVLRPLSEVGADLDQTWLAQPALFAVAYALAQLWMSWGVRPVALLGHSVGEFVAATIAGVFALEDALDLVAARGRIMQQAPEGAMLAVALAPEQLRPLLGADLALAAINAPESCVLSGCGEAVAAAERALAARGVETRRIRVTRAFHSPMMDSVVEPFADLARGVRLHAPRVPFISNVSGTWISDAEATDPRYWADHLRATVRFADGIDELAREPDLALLEVGPGQTLTTLLRQRPADGLLALASLGHPRDERPDELLALDALGRLWLAGAEVDWAGFSAHERRLRAPLPTYPFERKRHWVEPRRHGGAPGGPVARAGKADLADWFYLPAWRRSLTPALRDRATAHDPARTTLVLGDAAGLGERLARRMAQDGRAAILARSGDGFARGPDGAYTFDPRRAEDYAALLADLRAQGQDPATIVHCLGAAQDDRARSAAEQFAAAQDLGFYSLIFLCQALEAQPDRAPVEVVVITSDAQDVSGAERIRPEAATVLGACRVVAQECPHIRCRSVDIALADAAGPRADLLIGQLAAELARAEAEPTVAYRGRQRWVQRFEAARIDAATDGAARLREGGVYLITGGMGALGLALAKHLAQTARAKLILVGRSAHEESEAATRAVAALEELGAQTLVAQADVADHAQLRAVVERARARFGAIDGVFHAAGWTGEAALHPIRQTDRDMCERHFRPKAHGLLAIERAFEDQPPDFFLLFSSLAALLGGLGFVAYAAANSYMDAFAHSRSRAGSAPWISVNWDAWRMENPRASVDDLAITPAEGMECVRRILATDGAAQLAVSTSDLAARLDRWVERVAEHATPARNSAHARPPLRADYAPPRSETERAIAEVWQALIGVEAIGVDDNFFALGGHSLLATRVIARVRDALGVDLPLSSIFETPTVGGLAEAVAALRGADPALPLRPVARGGSLPLSFAQQRLWFLDQIEPDRATYNVPTAVRMAGALDLAAFARSLDALVRRHEILRTSFCMAGDQPAQIIDAARPVALPLIDLRALPPDAREAMARRLAQIEARIPFDLARGQLIRAALLRMGADECILLLTTHHIVSDGWSMGVLVQELTALYAAEIAGRAADLPDLPIQYADYAVWQRAWLRGPELDRQMSYWRARLADLPALRLPTDRAHPRTPTSRGAGHAFFTPPELRTKLAELGRAQGATLFMVLLAAFLIVLHHDTRADDLVIGTDVANRTRAEVEGLIGFFVNQITLRVDLAGVTSFRALLGRARDVVLEASAHQDLPFEQLVEALNPPREAGQHPLFQVKLVFQSAPAASARESGLSISPLAVAYETARFDLSLLIDDTPQGLHGKLEYKTELFDAATIARMAERFDAALRGVVAEPDASLERIEALIGAADLRARAVSEQSFEAASLQKLRSARRKAVPITSEPEDA